MFLRALFVAAFLFMSSMSAFANNACFDIFSRKNTAAAPTKQHYILDLVVESFPELSASWKREAEGSGEKLSLEMTVNRELVILSLLSTGTGTVFVSLEAPQPVKREGVVTSSLRAVGWSRQSREGKIVQSVNDLMSMASFEVRKEYEHLAERVFMSGLFDAPIKAPGVIHTRSINAEVNSVDDANVFLMFIRLLVGAKETSILEPAEPLLDWNFPRQPDNVAQTIYVPSTSPRAQHAGFRDQENGARDYTTTKIEEVLPVGLNQKVREFIMRNSEQIQIGFYSSVPSSVFLYFNIQPKSGLGVEGAKAGLTVQLVSNGKAIIMHSLDTARAGDYLNKGAGVIEALAAEKLPPLMRSEWAGDRTIYEFASHRIEDLFRALEENDILIQPLP